MFKKVTSFK